MNAAIAKQTNGALVLQYVGLTRDQVHAFTISWTSAPPSRRVYAKPRVTKERRKRWNSYHDRIVLQRIRKQPATIPITDRKLMLLCLDVAVARNLPVNAILSHRRWEPVVAARDEVFARAKSELGMTTSQIARAFGFRHTTISYGATRANL